MSDTTSTPTTGGAEMQPTGDRPITGAVLILEVMNAILATGSVAIYMWSQFTDLANSEAELDQAVLDLAGIFDNFVCLWFASQATWNLWRSTNLRQWLRWGWADYLASVPTSLVDYLVETEFAGWLRILRWVRLFLIIRAIRSTVRSVHGITILFDVGRAQSVMAMVFSLIVVSVVISSFVILGFESNGGEKANITGAKEALLWTLATLSGADTEGFGGLRPVTGQGQIINLWLVVVSLGLIGSLAGLISAWIEEEPDPEKLRERR